MTDGAGDLTPGRIYVFADEAGNFDFRRVAGATTYFVLTEVTMTDCRLAPALLELRRQLASEGPPDAGLPRHRGEPAGSRSHREDPDLPFWARQTIGSQVGVASSSSR